MSYRKIEVDGKTYEYTVGRTHLKVKGVGVIEREKIGYSRNIPCECCGEPTKAKYEGVISPKVVQKYIQDNI